MSTAGRPIRGTRSTRCLADGVVAEACEALPAPRDRPTVDARQRPGDEPCDRVADVASEALGVEDEDEQVRNFVSDPFRSLREEHVYTLRGFIEAYVASRALHSGLPEFAEYLWEHGPVDPPWALSVVEKVLSNHQDEQSELHFAGGEELIRLVLRVYTDPTVDGSTRAHAMDVFDQLMSKLWGPAQMVLKDWDRR